MPSDPQCLDRAIHLGRHRQLVSPLMLLELRGGGGAADKPCRTESLHPRMGVDDPFEAMRAALSRHLKLPRRTRMRCSTRAALRFSACYPLAEHDIRAGTNANRRHSWQMERRSRFRFHCAEGRRTGSLRTCFRISSRRSSSANRGAVVVRDRTRQGPQETRRRRFPPWPTQASTRAPSRARSKTGKAESDRIHRKTACIRGAPSLWLCRNLPTLHQVSSGRRHSTGKRTACRRKC